MTEERHEVYERIPWETLEKKSGDRQWLLMAIAGAVVVGSLAYSFVQSRPISPPPMLPVSETTLPTTSPSAPPPTSAEALPPPVVMTEADLYAVPPDRLADRAATHAEWFAVEYFTFDGSEQSRASLQGLLPAGVPLPEAPDGIQVFVDWVGTQAVTELSPLVFDVEVVVRSLVAIDDGPFTRQPPRVMTVEVGLGEDGSPYVSRPPSTRLAAMASGSSLLLSPLPADLHAQIESIHGRVLGGEQLADGRWQVVVMALGVDGVRRPATVLTP